MGSGDEGEESWGLTEDTEMDETELFNLLVGDLDSLWGRVEGSMGSEREKVGFFLILLMLEGDCS